MGQFSNPVATHPRTNEVEVPPPPGVKPTLSRSICHFLLFYNTDRLVSSDTITPVTTTSFLNSLRVNSPPLIRNQHDLDTLLDFLASHDFPSHLKDQRPNTKWVIEGIVSLRIHLVMTTYPLGNLTSLTILKTTDTSLVWKKMKILQKFTTTISASFVAWQLQNLEKPDITVT